ncbi:polyketide cyclase /reductase [Amycolatopsis thailandensis]|uniref:Polyketide cyclase /reductase n=1 Tax=Amycolatopsis thailandensis TaxID=589330 RepID=A0A229RKX1_9PSEU|nr:SRPBCC family protein [Amycolatopsis thailandensis]OXM47297.1 polyketide cyclase /reductase [Amycolatopsis thailandensis]
MTNTKPRRRTAVLALPLALGLLGGAVTPAQAATASAPLSCQGKTIDTKAPIHYRTETLINAPLSEIWRLQTDVERWPSWQKPVLTNERLDRGPLRKNSRFRWTTPVPATATTPATTLSITSTVHQIQRGQCVRWSGPAIGDGLRIDNGVHVWNFTEVKGGVLVRTEENWSGAQVEAEVPTSTRFLGMGLEAWLKDLKTTAEAHC